MAEGIKLEGFIDIDIISPKNNLTRHYHNTITKGGKQYFLAHAAADMLGMSASLRGNMIENSGICNKTVASNILYTNFNQSHCITNALLNLGTTIQNGLTESSTFANLFEATGLVGNKVVGYANNNIIPTANGKEGTIDYCKDEYVADGYTVCERWKYDAGVATGQIDTIAMLPSGWATSGLGGQRTSKCLDKVNTQYANYVAKSTQFCPPGITGFTTNDEILLNYSQDSKTKHKYTISTGVMTDLADTDPWFVFPVNTCDIIKLGDYIYALDTSKKVWVYLASGMVSQTSFNASFTITSPINYRFVTDTSGNLYVSAITLATGASSGNFLTALIKSGAYYNAVGTGYSDWNQLGITFPTGLNKYEVNFGMYGTNLMMYVRQGNYNSSDNYMFTGLVFTDRANVITSLIEAIPQLTHKSVTFVAGTNSGVIDNGFDNLYYENYKDTDTYCRNVINNSGTKAITPVGGIYISLNGWWTTLLSFVKLATAITKADTDIMYVSYGYKIV